MTAARRRRAAAPRCRACGARITWAIELRPGHPDGDLRRPLDLEPVAGGRRYVIDPLPDRIIAVPVPHGDRAEGFPDHRDACALTRPPDPTVDRHP